MGGQRGSWFLIYFMLLYIFILIRGGETVHSTHSSICLRRAVISLYISDGVPAEGYLIVVQTYSIYG